MRIFTNKNLIQKIFIALLLAILISMSFTNVVHADGDDDGLGGKLLKPIADLLKAIGDGIVGIVHNLVQDQDESIIRVSKHSNTAKLIATVVLGVLAALVVAVVVGGLVVTLGTAITFLGPLLLTKSFVGGMMTVSALIGGVATSFSVYTSDYWGGEVVLPLYSISPEEIFSNQVLLLDINFFNPKSNYSETTFDSNSYFFDEKKLYEPKYSSKLDDFLDQKGSSGKTLRELLGIDTDKYISDQTKVMYYYYNIYDNVMEINKPEDVKAMYEDFGEVSDFIFTTEFENINNFFFGFCDGFDSEGYSTFSSGIYYFWDDNIKSAADLEYFLTMHQSIIDKLIDFLNKMKNQNSAFYLDAFNRQGQVGDLYFRGNISNLQPGMYDEIDVMLNEDIPEIISLLKNYNSIVREPLLEEVGEIKSVDLFSTANELRPVISSWYYVLRNIAIILSILVLVYVGIRILICSTANDKAKYKQMLVDWLVSICLIFVMQYIMVFSITIVEKFTELITEITPTDTIAVIDLSDDKLKEKVLDVLRGRTKDESSTEQENFEDSIRTMNGTEYLFWHTNLMGKARVNANQKIDTTVNMIGWTIIFLVLVFFLVFFLFTYLKRVVYMAFLTIIAPLVALTYPIDKLNDGKAQAFNMWFKEYIFNLLIQPMHLLLYYILIISAFELASDNMLYSIVALGFMMPAEKLIRKFFGFEKAQTPGLLAGAGGAALAMSGIRALGRFGHKKPGKGESKESGAKDNDDEIRGANSGINFDNEYLNAFGGGGAIPQPGKSALPQPGGGSILQSGVNTTLPPAGTNAREWLENKNQALAKKGRLSSLYGSTLGNISQNARNVTFRGALKKSLPLAGKTFKSAANLGLRGAGIATLGILGGALGVASGDISNVGQYAITGAMAGNAAGRGVSNVLESASSGAANIAGEARQNYLHERYGTNYDQYIRNKKDIDFYNDIDKRNLYARELGLNSKEQINEAMTDAIKYRQYNVTDDKIILKTMQKINGERASKEKIMLARLAKETAGKQKEIDTAMKRLRENGVSEAKIKQIASQIRLISGI